MPKYKIKWDKVYDVHRLFTIETDDEGEVEVHLAEFYDKEIAEYCLRQLNMRERLKEISRLGQEMQPEYYKGGK